MVLICRHYYLDLPPNQYIFAAKSVLIWRQIAPVHARCLCRSRTTSPPFSQSDFHLRRNGNRHFTLYLQGRDDFQNLQVSLARTVDGTVKASPPAFFLRARVKEQKWKVAASMHILPAK